MWSAVMHWCVLHSVTKSPDFAAGTKPPFVQKIFTVYGCDKMKRESVSENSGSILNNGNINLETLLYIPPRTKIKQVQNLECK